MGRQTWFQFQGRFQCWTWNLLTAGPRFSLLWKICQKTAMEVVDFAVDFCGGFLWSQNTKEKSAEKIRRKIRQLKTKKSAGARPPPEIRQPGPKIRHRTYQQIRLSNLQVQAGFFRLRKIALGGVFRAWILGHSLAAFWAWSRLLCWNALAIPQLLLVGWTRFAAHPSRQHF